MNPSQPPLGTTRQQGVRAPHDVPALRHATGAAVTAGRHAVPVSDKRYWWALLPIGALALGAVAMAAYLLFIQLDTSKSVDHFAVSDSLKVGAGGALGYLASGTVAVSAAGQADLPSSTPVSIPVAPSVPRIHLSLVQGGSRYRGVSLYATEVTNSSFVVKADLVTRGVVQGDGSSAGDSVALDGTDASITTPFHVSWLALA